MLDHRLLAAPMAALDTPAASGLRWVTSRCLRSAPYHQPCERCTSHCPAEALVFCEDDHQTQQLRATGSCHGCGACLPTCPTDALLSVDVEALSNDLMQNTTSSQLKLSCHRSHTTDTTAHHCLRALGLDQLQHWRQQLKLEKIELYVADDCQSCPAASKNGQSDFWWQQMHDSPNIQLRPELNSNANYEPARGARLSRRSLFAGQARAEITIPELEQAATARRQQRLFHALESMSEPLPVLPQAALDPNRCDAHGICSSVCPTKALSVNAEGSLHFDPLACTDCGACQTHCPTQALTFSQGNEHQSYRLNQSVEHSCFDCGRAFRTTKSTEQARPRCPACERDQSLFKEDFHQLFG